MSGLCGSSGFSKNGAYLRIGATNCDVEECGELRGTTPRLLVVALCRGEYQDHLSFWWSACVTVKSWLLKKKNHPDTCHELQFTFPRPAGHVLQMASVALFSRRMLFLAAWLGQISLARQLGFQRGNASAWKQQKEVMGRRGCGAIRTHCGGTLFLLGAAMDARAHVSAQAVFV